MKDYLFYVRFALSGLTVYHCKTADPTVFTADELKILMK